MLLLCQLLIHCTAAWNHSLIISDDNRLMNVNNFLKLECNYFEFNNIVSVASNTDNNEDIFIDIRNIIQRSMKRVFVFNNCDFSQSKYFIMQDPELLISGLYNIDIEIRHTNIGNGFAQTLMVNSVRFIDCTIDLSALSGNGVISANHVSFVNCKFIGELSNERRSNPVLEYSYRAGQDIQMMNDYSVEFIDCGFGLSENWKNSIYNINILSDDPRKQFIVIRTQHESGSALKSVSILFRRCYYIEGSYSGNLRLIKSVASEDKYESIVSVVGDNSGVNVDWCFVVNENNLDYSVGDWENIVASTGYFPVSDTVSNPDNNPESIAESTPADANGVGNTPKGNSSNKSNAWMIVAIVFIIAFVVLVAALVIIFIFKKRSFDKSDRENNLVNKSFLYIRYDCFQCQCSVFSY